MVPVGGGIPGGVLLAQRYGLAWPIMLGLYFVSDVVLACLFEPIMNTLRSLGRRNAAFAQIIAAFKAAVERSVSHVSRSRSPLALVLISFGVDPMTGRAAALTAGYGFIGGWAIAIAGDLIYFSVLMVSTLWLNSLLGDGTTTMWIVLALMFGVPPLIRRIRGTTDDARGSAGTR